MRLVVTQTLGQALPTGIYDLNSLLGFHSPVLHNSRGNTPAMSAEVFISYARDDRERVMPLVDRLRSAGVATCVDEGNVDAATL